MKIFIDTSAFVALANRDDLNHQIAKELFLNSIKKNERFITTNYVISETITLIRFQAGFDKACEFGRKFRNTKLIDVYWIDRILDDKIWGIFLKYKDKDFSYIDCSSFTVMKNNNIQYAFTFDKHFEQIGFLKLSYLL